MNDKEIEDKLQKTLDRMTFLEMQKMLKILSENYTEKTQVFITNGQRNVQRFWIQEKNWTDGQIEIRLIPFFGMMVGYDKDHDILVCSRFNNLENQKIADPGIGRE